MLVLKLWLHNSCYQGSSIHYYQMNISLLWNQLIGPWRSEWNFRLVIFKPISVTDGWGISNELVLIWVSIDFTGGKSTLVQVIAWCRHAKSHYLSQCWRRSLSPYGVPRPQWVKREAAYIHPYEISFNISLHKFCFRSSWDCFCNINETRNFRHLWHNLLTFATLD